MDAKKLAQAIERANFALMRHDKERDPKCSGVSMIAITASDLRTLVEAAMPTRDLLKAQEA